MIAIIEGTPPKIANVTPQQLPIMPIPPPPPGAEALGSMSWDLPDSMVYVPYEQITAIIELVNQTSEEKLYGLAYYFIDPSGAIASQDYIYFVTDSLQFAAFSLPPHGTIPMTTSLTFNAPDAGYKFGLRMLLLELVDTTAVVIQETNRLEVSLMSSYNGDEVSTLEAMMPIIMMVMLIGVMGSMMKGTKTVKGVEK